MRSRTLLAALLTAALSGTALTAQAQPTTSPDPQVRVTGTLVRTAVEEAGGRQHFGVLSEDRVVPVDGAGLEHTAPGSRVSIDVAVPRAVLRRSSPTAPTATLRAASRDTALAPGGDPLSVTEVLSAEAAPQAATSTRKITYVEVTPKGVTRDPVTSAVATRQVSAADAYWSDQSGGRIRMGAPTMKPHYTSIYTCSDDPMARFDEALVETGWRVEDNSSLVLALPRSTASTCGYGLGTLGATTSAPGLLHVADTRYPVLAHELGHNISLDHANSLMCSGRSDTRNLSDGSWDGGCREAAYGDSLDVMGVSGSTAPMLSSPQALAKGLMPSSAATAVGPGTTRVTLRPVSGMAGTRAAVVTNRGSGVKYWVELRAATGRDATNPLGQTTGVRVLRLNSKERTSVLLDPTPTGTRDNSMSLAAGRTLTSYDGTIAITTESVSSTQAVVRIANTSTPKSFALVAGPRITGTKGVGRTLTATNGSWSPTPSSYGYRWRRNGVAISGATGRTYTPTRWDAGRYLTVTVTARRTGYTAKSSVSPRVGIPIHATQRPYLVGTPRAWSRLTVYVGSWTPKPTSYAYRWYRDGRVISGATAKTYTVRSIDRGHRIQAKVIARRTGYSTGMQLTYSTTIRS